MARGDFEIVNEKPIGCGQFGTVFRARRRADGRMAALKLILHQGQNGEDAIAAERRGATLQQGFSSLYGMVPEVFEFGPDGEDFYIAMDLVEGQPLTRYREERGLAIRARIELLIRVCRAVHYAHQRGVIHRDLKPSNVLATEVDGMAVPKVNGAAEGSSRLCPPSRQAGRDGFAETASSAAMIARWTAPAPISSPSSRGSPPGRARSSSPHRSPPALRSLSRRDRRSRGEARAGSSSGRSSSPTRSTSPSWPRSRSRRTARTSPAAAARS